MPHENQYGATEGEGWLATTAGGDAYSFSEYVAMFRQVGFTSNEFVPLPAGPQSVIVSRK